MEDWSASAGAGRWPEQGQFPRLDQEGCRLPADSSARSVIRRLVAAVDPGDRQEKDDRQWMLDWIDSGAQLFRLAKPANPPQHLAVYSILIDEPTRSMMIVWHVLAQAWLFPGGHVDDLEDLRAAVVRELAEELQIAPAFHPEFGDDPFFLTVTQTRGADSHTDITLWFVFQTDRDDPITPDEREFGEVLWVPTDDRTVWPAGVFDPALERFLTKLTGRLGPKALLSR